MESPRVAGILFTASKEDLAVEPTVVVLLGVHAARRRDLTEAIRLFEAAATIAVNPLSGPERGRCS